MIFFASIIFSGSNWPWVAAAVFGLAVLLAAWSYRIAPRGWVRWICAALKLVGVSALAFCLLEPLWSGQRVRPGANVFAVLADNSQGLQIKDHGAIQTRGEILRSLLDPQENKWQASLDENFEVRRYLFDSRLQASKDFSELAFDGRATALGTSLRNLADRYRGRPLAGVLLFTDGNATDWREIGRAHV